MRESELGAPLIPLRGRGSPNRGSPTRRRTGSPVRPPERGSPMRAPLQASNGPAAGFLDPSAHAAIQGLQQQVQQQAQMIQRLTTSSSLASAGNGDPPPPSLLSPPSPLRSPQRIGVELGRSLEKAEMRGRELEYQLALGNHYPTTL